MHLIMSEDTRVLKWIRRLLVLGYFFVPGMVGKSGQLTWNNFINGNIWGSLAYIFIHGSIVHLIVNVVSFTKMGEYIAEVYGETKAVFLFFITGITSGVISAFVYNLTPSLSEVPIVGCSGAICGWFGYAIFDLLRSKQYGAMAINLIAIIASSIVMPTSIVIHFIGILCGFFINAFSARPKNHKSLG